MEEPQAYNDQQHDQRKRSQSANRDGQLPGFHLNDRLGLNSLIFLGIIRQGNPIRFGVGKSAAVNE